jgi:hypothetical protein
MGYDVAMRRKDQACLHAGRLAQTGKLRHTHCKG